MDPDFWQQRWEQGQIGFHQPDVHAALKRFAPLLGNPGRIFVPLAGKSVDLLWLMSQGWEVTAVELSATAVRRFFEENGITAERTQVGQLSIWTAGKLRFLQGDVFDTHDDGFDACWDRAATVALPEPMRTRYAQHVAARLRPGAKTLLVTIERIPASDVGPPFSIPESSVRALYEPMFEISLLDRDETSPAASFGAEVTWLMNKV